MTFGKCLKVNVAVKFDCTIMVDRQWFIVLIINEMMD